MSENRCNANRCQSRSRTEVRERRSRDQSHRNLQANAQHLQVRVGPTPNVQRRTKEDRNQRSENRDQSPEAEVRVHRSEQPSGRLAPALMLVLSPEMAEVLLA